MRSIGPFGAISGAQTNCPGRRWATVSVTDPEPTSTCWAVAPLWTTKSSASASMTATSFIEAGIQKERSCHCSSILAGDLLTGAGSSPYGKIPICRIATFGQRGGMNWKSIRLELGSTGEFPAGSVSRAYLVRVPLDDSDMIDELALQESPNKAIVLRHWSTEPDEKGLIRRADGHWSMHCEGKDRKLCVDSHPL